MMFDTTSPLARRATNVISGAPPPLLGACHCCQPRPRRWPLRPWKDDRGAWRVPAGQGRRAPPAGAAGTRN
eukprot:9429090-Alexandrium_andersonii.AAC.1